MELLLLLHQYMPEIRFYLRLRANNSAGTHVKVDVRGADLIETLN